jgi:pimeloyl-ACP methyl ester carboxylesterase
MKNKSKLFLLLTLASSLVGLSGCGGGSGTETPPEPTPTETFVEGTAPRFNPILSDLPFNTDVLFADAAASDGTANLGAATDPVRAALNVADGLSTSAYFDILINGSVNPETVIALQTVFLIQVNTGTADALNPANIIGLVGPAQFDVRVVSLDGGTNNVIRVRPTRPLKAKSKYLVFLTNDVRDAANARLTRSWHYNALRDATFEVSGKLLSIQNAIIGWETLASGFLAAVSDGQLTTATAKEKLVLSYTFTTTDPLAPLVAMASPRAVIAGIQIGAGVPAETAVGNVVQLDNLNVLPTPKARPVGVSGLTAVDINTLTGGLLPANIGTLYTGYIKLPYYQTAAAGLPFGAYLTRNWRPDLALAGMLGIQLPDDVDGSYNVTYRYPFAAKTSDETVPLQVTMPNDATVPGYAGPANCGQIYSATGYPVVIYVHGITSDRASVLALGHTLASRCIATVAIDLPLHGIPATSALVNVLNVERNPDFAALYGDDAPHERHFNVAGPGGAPAPMNFEAPTAADGSGAQFTNLGYLANTRDNNRQGVMDLLNLNASLVNVNTAMSGTVDVGLDLDRVYLIGMSLGGIIGEVFVTVNQLAIANDAMVGLASNLNPINGVVLASAGSQVSQIMINSPTFGPIINNGLAASGVVAGTTNYERFVYAAQATLDSADVVNFAQTFATLGVPVLLTQIANDQVIVNSTPNAPLAGTEALASLLGATQIGLGSHELGRGFVKMNAGGHSSMLRPEGGAPQVTAELQAQAVSFILSNGTVGVGSQAPGDVATPPEAP